MILKLLEVIVLKFKSIAKYQVTHLLEQSNVKSSESIKSNEKDTLEKSLQNNGTTTHQSDTRTHMEKLDAFLNSYEDKDRIKVN